MLSAKADIIAQLQREVLSLQGIKPLPNGNEIDIVLRDIKYAFPNKSFPLSAVHEFVSMDAECKASTCGFISCLISCLMKNGGAIIWASASRKIFPIALASYGISAERIVFITADDQKEILWAIEEALKCEGLAAVIGEVKDLNFTESRRLQLAVEKSGVTGFIIRDQPRSLNINACVSRWKISPLNSVLLDDLPGIGFPSWNIELLKIRNGRPGAWQMEWSGKRLKMARTRTRSFTEGQERKAI